MSEYKLTVGMEVHIELETKTKMFCGCKNDPFGSEPNTNVCPVCYGLPGALPLINKEAVLMTARLGKALKGQITTETFWARKNYFYPDLPKGYQISQSSAPIVEDAVVTIDGVDHHIERIHLEEDAGKLAHAGSSSLVDYNRAGVPLMEIVTKPDFHSAEEAKRFCQELQRIVRALKIATADMEKGRMRCEANISVAPINPKFETPNSKQIQNSNDQNSKLGTKVEVKNINSFRAVEKTINYEFGRQTKALEQGEEIIQETRTWDDAGGKTVSMRTKETSADYRYFPEPDLPIVKIDKVAEEKISLPEDERQQLIEAGVSPALATVIVDRGQTQAVLALGEEAPELTKIYLANNAILELTKDQIAQILAARKTHQLTKDQLNLLIEQAKNNPDSSLDELTKSLSGQGLDLQELITQVLAEQPNAVADYKAGKQNALHFLVGQVMAKAKGRANIQAVRDALQHTLS